MRAMKPQQFRTPKREPRAAAGFSIVEMIIAIAIVAILASIATPSLASMMTRHRVQDASSDLFAALIAARNKAVTLNSDVKLVPVGTGWASGWKIPDPENATRALDVHKPVASVDIAMSGASAITYQFNGRIRGGIGVKFTLTSTARGYATRACIVVDPSGRPYTQDAPC